MNGYDSPEDQERVYDAYAGNTRWIEATTPNSQRKASLTFEPIDLVAHHRPDLSSGTPWILGHGRFLVVALTKGDHRAGGTVFEAGDGTRLAMRAAMSREEADAAATDPDARVLVVRPSWSFPAREWIAADPQFWFGSTQHRGRT